MLLSGETSEIIKTCHLEGRAYQLFNATAPKHTSVNINVWVTENTGKSRGYTENCCKYITNPWLFTAIEDISLII